MLCFFALVAPKFTVLAQNPTEAIEGFSVMLDCTAEGDPKPTIHWDKNLKMNDFNRSRSVLSVTYTIVSLSIIILGLRY